MKRLLSLALALMVGSAARLPEPRQCAASAEGVDILIPRGVAIIGDDSGYPEEHGAYETVIPAFRIDRHEVTNRDFARFVRATGYVTDAERAGASIVFAPPSRPVPELDPRLWWALVKGADWRHPRGPESSIAGRDYFPVVQVSYTDAAAYARWAGRALPDEEQFEYAAAAGAGPVRQPPPADAANTWQGRFPDTNYGTDGYLGLAPVGCYRANGFGVRDMIGNAWEWTSSRYGADHRPTAAAPSPQRVVKGGSFLCARNYCARFRPAAREGQGEHEATSHLGFRTVAR